MAKEIIDKDPEKNKELIFQKTESPADQGQNNNQVNQLDDDESDDENAGATPLHIAIEWNQVEMVEYLVELGGEELIRTKNAEG